MEDFSALPKRLSELLERYDKTSSAEQERVMVVYGLWRSRVRYAEKEGRDYLCDFCGGRIEDVDKWIEKLYQEIPEHHLNK